MKVVGEAVCAPDNWIPLNEGLLEYRGLLHAMPQLVNNNISVMNRLDELRKAQISQKVSHKFYGFQKKIMGFNICFQRVKTVVKNSNRITNLS